MNNFDDSGDDDDHIDNGDDDDEDDHIDSGEKDGNANDRRMKVKIFDNDGNHLYLSRIGLEIAW